MVKEYLLMGWREEFEIDLIKKLVDDKYDYIEYFIYDKNWGTDKKYNIYDEKIQGYSFK